MLHSTLLPLVYFCSLVVSLPQNHREDIHHTQDATSGANVCVNEQFSFYDYSVKKAPSLQAQDQSSTCVPERALLARQNPVEDYSCSESKPCSNGACCSKKTGYCNYGPEACGTNGQSPNDVCWSNCNAHAECGVNAKIPGQTCPLNVCCSQYGFCGIDSGGEFCGAGCQSNCKQPGSGGSGGNVQSRVIGYYEAWAHDRKCSGMPFNKIPSGSMTHAYFSFGYITPGDYRVVPMDDLPASLFDDFNDIKTRNPAVKTVIALGGWTFNDNDTVTQPVYSDMVSSSANRQKFIGNLISFLRQYGFDGVDFDWEYPGAPDRGGRPDDGKNFVTFLAELRTAISKEPLHYVVSFTIPTSFWYLRWFDLKAVDYVDWVNVMSYDLHGVWDAQNPIGSQVLAHTNLTEIKLALDLLWRNNVKPDKVNLGLGFYGRSFQLADPSCSAPGCRFLGGAAPGPCTQNSGTLSYKEITEIITANKLTPIYDRTNAVKYITWNEDQWVSYDDQETFKQKIDFANGLGLGGLLIWAVDLDTLDLKALKGVVAPKSLNVFLAEADASSYWGNTTAESCYQSDCDQSCKAGFISIADIGCGKKKSRHVCCPVSSAPNPADCTWRGNPTACNGQCHAGELTMTLDKNGAGGYCVSGNKMFCCKVADNFAASCYWRQGGCNPSDTEMTWRGPWGIHSESFCCPSEDAKRWKNCNWKGSGRCDSNHCDILTEVELTTSYSAEGGDCGIFDRKRAFCCTPTDQRPLFLPVPLDRLFKEPPKGDNVHTDFGLEEEDTWGKGSDQTPNEDDQNSSTFMFYVLASPEEIQTSLNKRDGSHWEVYNCLETKSEEPQTIQMFCTDLSPESNCHKIHLGHGPVGTIVELPDRCGPGKYGVVKSMSISQNQTVPRHLVKRAPEGHTVYDLTFDYDFRRVPRDLGDTQLRVDFANQEGYWDSVVEKAAGTKKKKIKRSLDDMGRNHKRWLEEEWRDDLHYGALSRDELHKRWFGSDVIDWLRRIVSTALSGTVQHSHSIDEEFTVKILEESKSCNIKGVDVTGKLDVKVNANVKVDTSFGVTIITKLSSSGMDLSNSYMFFRNKGSVTAGFVLDALAAVTWQSGDIPVAGLSNYPGLTVTVPGIMTLGPDFRLVVAMEAQIVIAAHVDANMELAAWDVHETFPVGSGDYNPKADAQPGPGRSYLPSAPTVKASVTANGQLTAHLKPTFSFGIRFLDKWNVPNCVVDLVADGWVRLHAEARAGTGNTCPFSYGVDGGASLYAKIDAPSNFGGNWGLASNPWTIAQLPTKQFPVGKTCDTGPLSIREVPDWLSLNGNETTSLAAPLTGRGITIGPPVHLSNLLSCPSDGTTETQCAKREGDEAGDDDDDSFTKRDPLGLHHWEKRKPKKATICGVNVFSADFRSAKAQRNIAPAWWGFEPNTCDNMHISNVKGQQAYANKAFATEHVLEYELLKEFWTKFPNQAIYPDPAGGQNPVSFCAYWTAWWGSAQTFTGTTLGAPYNQIAQSLSPAGWLGFMFPSQHNPWENELILLDGAINRGKESLWQGGDFISKTCMDKLVTGGTCDTNPPRVGIDGAIRMLRYCLGLWDYHVALSPTLKTQADRVADAIDKFDAPGGTHVTNAAGVAYTTLNAKTRWLQFVRTRCQQVMDKQEAFFNEYYPKVQQYQAANAAAMSQVQNNRIAALGNAIAVKQAWVNPI